MEVILLRKMDFIFYVYQMSSLFSHYLPCSSMFSHYLPCYPPVLPCYPPWFSYCPPWFSYCPPMFYSDILMLCFSNVSFLSSTVYCLLSRYKPLILLLPTLSSRSFNASSRLLYVVTVFSSYP